MSIVGEVSRVNQEKRQPVSHDLVAPIGHSGTNPPPTPTDTNTNDVVLGAVDGKQGMHPIGWHGGARDGDGALSHEETRERTESQVGELARQLTRQSSHPAQRSPSRMTRQLTGQSDQDHQHSRHPDGVKRQSSRQPSGPTDNLFDYEPESDLDPFSSSFNARKYVRGLAKLSKTSGQPRTAGIAYRDLSVHGFGSDAGEWSECSVSCLGERANSLWGCRLSENGRQSSVVFCKCCSRSHQQSETQSTDP